MRSTDVQWYKNDGSYISREFVVLKMSYATHRDRWPSRPSRITLLLIIFALSLMTITLQRVDASPLLDLAQEYQNLVSENSTNNSTDSTDSTDNSTASTDVYIIKAVVYEIGVLTDTDNTTSSESTERHERIDISVYDPPHQEN